MRIKIPSFWIPDNLLITQLEQKLKLTFAVSVFLSPRRFSNCFETILRRARFSRLRPLPPCWYSLLMKLIVWSALPKQLIRREVAYFATAKSKSVDSLLSLLSIARTTVFMFSTVAEEVPWLSWTRIITSALLLQTGLSVIRSGHY